MSVHHSSQIAPAPKAPMLRILQRNFGSVSITSFVITVVAPWPALASLIKFSLSFCSEADRHH